MYITVRYVYPNSIHAATLGVAKTGGWYWSARRSLNDTEGKINGPYESSHAARSQAEISNPNCQLDPITAKYVFPR
ncbi:hypothetical protein LCGC14_1185410 [marine sediment metagenome]|uniref:Uncharacterized protein n=1 Tax=marine sediment metagenome TaxID=412755 RepID=A0A0F9LKX0_9ZZZZ